MARGCRTILCPGVGEGPFQELQEGVHELQLVRQAAWI